MRGSFIAQSFAQQCKGFPNMRASAVLTSSAIPEVEPERGPAVSHFSSPHSEYNSLTTLHLLLTPILFKFPAYGSITGNDELQASSRLRVSSTSITCTQTRKSAAVDFSRTQDQQDDVSLLWV